MAKDEKSKVRVFVLEVEGSDRVIEDSLKAVTAALTRSQAVVRMPNHSPQLVSAASQPVSEPQDSLFDDEEIQQPRSSGKSSAPRKLPIPKVIDLDLKSGDPDFEAFAALKSPDSNNKKYLVVATWLKENLGLDAIGIDHLYTCFRAVKWAVPDDVGAPFRDMRKKRYGYFNAGSERGTFAINHIGVGVVDKLGVS